MRKEIDGLLVAEWTTQRERPTGYVIETAEDGQISLVELLKSFDDSGDAVFVRITVQREDVDGNPS